MESSLLSPSEAGVAPDSYMIEAEKFVKAALDAMTSHIAILSEEGVIIHVNQAWRRFGEQNGFGDQSYGVGTNYLTVCDAAHTQDAAAVARGIRGVQQREIEEFRLEYPCHSPVERRWFVVRVTRFSWYGHVRLIVAHQNITELKKVQSELLESQRWLQAVLDNLVDGVMIFDHKGVIESVNPAATLIFGYAPGELAGQNVTHLLPALDSVGRKGLGKFLERVLGLGDEIEGRRKDGIVFPMYFAVSEIKMDNRHVYTALIQDFTERKFLEGQIWEKERLNLQLEKERELRDLKNRFISMMSHELRTPLAAIQLANSMLRNYGDRSSEEEKHESYDAIDQQVAFLNELIGDVMAISRTDFTGAEFNPEVMDLETYCRDIIEELQLAYRMQCCLEFNGTGKRIEAVIDRKLMRRALSNLLTNAIKYSPEGSPITLDLALEDGTAIVRVSDHGIGIPQDDLRQLFEPFHRASNVGTIQGTGLGLAIAKQAVDLHHGSIRADSEVGVGTTFTIRLPLSRPTTPSQ